MRTALFWAITQRVVLISYRRFGTSYRAGLILDPFPKLGAEVKVKVTP